MPGYFGGSSSGYFGGSSTSGYFGGSSEKKKHHSFLGKVVAPVGHLAGDVKDATIGFFPGLIATAKHPIRGAEEMAHMEWQTWSPLFHGQFGKFGKQVYDHPLAPLLDVATVFSLGLDALTLGAASPVTAGLIGTRAAGKLGSLRAASTVYHIDPAIRDIETVAKAGGNKIRPSMVQHGKLPAIIRDEELVPRGVGRAPVVQGLSQRPMRRLIQEGRLKHIEPHLPSWYTEARYARKLGSEMSHRSRALNQRVANSLGFVAVLKGGEALSDPEVWGAARQAIVENMHQGLDIHAPSYVHQGQKLPKGYRYVTNPEDVAAYVKGIDSPEDFELFLRSKPHQVTTKTGKVKDNPGFGAVATTRSAKRAIMREDGTMPIVPSNRVAILGEEAARSSFLMRKAWRYPTTIWKTVTLGYAPRTVVNNAVGNWLLYAARQNPGAAIAGLHDAIRLTHGDAAARRLGTPEALGATDSLWHNKYHLDELQDTFGIEMLGEEATHKSLKGGVYPLVHKTSDRPVRLAALASFYRRNPEVKRLMRDKRMTFDQAVDTVAGDASIRAQAATYTRSIAGDYTTMTKAATAVKDLMPFYLWNRHILKSAGNMTLDTPGRVVAYQRISNMGTEEVEKILGAVPEWLRGSVPLEMLGFHANDGRRAKLITTQSLNPFATIGDLATMGQALTVGGTKRPASEVLGQLNPFLQGSVEALTGESLLTGGKKPTHGGFFSTLGVNTLEAFPQWKLGQELISPDTEVTPKGNPYLYARNDESAISAIFGVPIKSVDLMRAHDLASK